MGEWVSTALGAAAATVFASLGLAKASGFARFASSIGEYQLVPSTIAKPIALVIIGSELALSVGFLMPSVRCAAARLGVALLTVLMGAMGIVLLQGRRGVDCGCTLRPGRTPVGAGSLLRGAGLVLVLLLVGSTNVSPVALSGMELMNAAAAGVTAALLYLAIETLTVLPSMSRSR